MDDDERAKGKHTVIVVAVAFLLMEAFTYVAHRWIMHGFGWAWHKSHHQPPTESPFETNDLYPVVFAGMTIMAMAAGTVSSGAWHLLVGTGIGVTAYGAAYLFVHDVYIHQRLGRLPRFGLLDRLGAAHRIHHLYGGEPYGMLLPIVPAALKERAAKTLVLEGSRAYSSR